MSARHHFDQNRFYEAQLARLRGQLDSVAVPGRSGRVDGAVIFSELVKQTNYKLHEYVYRPTPFASEVAISANTSLPIGTTSVDEYSIKHVDPTGDGFTSEDSTVPRVGLELDPENVRLHPLPVAYRTTMGEMEQWALQGFGNSLPSRLADAAGEYWHRKLDAALRSGVTDKFNGVINYTGSLQIVAGDIGTTATWSTASPDQIVASFGIVRQQIDDAGDNLSPNTVILPTSLRATMKKQRSIGSDMTIEMWLKAQYPEITLWLYDRNMSTAGIASTACMVMYDPLWLYDRNMSTAGIASTACMVMYDRNPETLYFHMPMRMQPTPELVQHTSIEQAFRTWVSPAFCTRPRSIARISGI
jgi:hypothetical protein